MSRFSLPFGSSNQIVEIDDRFAPQLILPSETPPADDPFAIVEWALDQPLGFDWDQVSSGMQVAIAVNDKTRPVPNQQLLPGLLNRLKARGIPSDHITFWIATGSHLPMQIEEFSKVLPQAILQDFQVKSHNTDDLDNLIYLGTTGRGTPVWVNKSYYQADLKIVTGDIEPHHFAGFSGGYKSAAIGLAGRPTINHNHAMLVDPNAWIGVYDVNPLRQDIEEIGTLIKVDLALNAVLTQHKQIAAAFFGHPLDVIRKGIPVVQQICGSPCIQKFDIVVASAGGHPKDINFYQAQKALTHASLFCKPGGSLILAAACPEGTGNRAYEEFMRGLSSADEVMARFRQQEFRVGPHKAFQVARLLNDFTLYLVSDISPDLVSRLLMRPSASVQAALDECLNTSSHKSVAVLPHATTTIALR